MLRQRKRKASDSNEPLDVSFVPPGANTAYANEQCYGVQLDHSFQIPKRLINKNAGLVEAVNDWHFSMVNDFDRNMFYKICLQNVLQPGSRVLEIGTGTGLLAIIAARLGCKWVVTVEANQHMAELARDIIEQNNFSNEITVINKLSTELCLDDFPNSERPDVLVSEIFGTLLLGEGVHDYVQDARNRVLTRRCKVIPPRGRQMATLIDCPAVRSVISTSGWDGIDLSRLNTFQDTVQILHTKQLGFRLSDVGYTAISEPICLLDIDFESFNLDDMPQTLAIKVQAMQSGVVHAVLLTWECFGHSGCGVLPQISTHPDKTSFERDMAWGQGLQLVADLESPSGMIPKPISVNKGEKLDMKVQFAENSVLMQVELTRCNVKPI